jgi:hypothetical protein
MILLDANILIYAFRRDAARHEEYRRWLESSLANEPAIGLSHLVLAAVVRITTHPRVFAQPSTLEEVFRFTEFLRTRPNAVRIMPGARHWEIFADLSRRTQAKGNLITDAYLAALAVEAGAEWITTDHDFSRFSGLRWRHPLAASS